MGKKRKKAAKKNMSKKKKRKRKRWGTIERFAYNVKAFREEFGYTQKALSEKLEVHVQTVKKWESGRLAPACYIDSLAKLFKCDQSELLERPT